MARVATGLAEVILLRPVSDSLESYSNPIVRSIGFPFLEATVIKQQQLAYY